MKAVTMVQQHPPTPPSGNIELQYGFHHLVNHNTGHHYHHDYREAQYPNRQGSTYGSPCPMMQEVGSQQSGEHFQSQRFESGPYPDHHGGEFGLGIQYDGYGAPPNYFQHDSHDIGLPYAHRGTLSGSPSTPMSATDNSEIGRQTRSGRSIARSGSPQTGKARVVKTTKTKKAKANKADKPKTPKLTAPLSVLTRGFANIPVRNMEEWVNRPPEVRRAEVEKRNGYVTRPMNSFMLYRSAYADRTKQWCLQNNHQVVSSVSGESWPMEPPEVRELYNDYAKIERINHQNANPTYKFSPSKASSAARKRKGEYSEEEDEMSELDDPDAEWGPPGQRRSRGKSTRRQGKRAGYPSNSNMTTGFDGQYFGPNNGMNKSAWEVSNEGKPLPVPMGQVDLYNQYYQMTIQPNMSVPGIEDVRMRRMDTPGIIMQFPQGHSLLGLPGGRHPELLQMHTHMGTPIPHESQVDPMLLAFDDQLGGQLSQTSDVIIGMEHHTEFGNGHIGMMERELDQESVHSFLGSGAVHEEYRPEAWQVDTTVAPMEPGSEFDKWMDDHPAS